MEACSELKDKYDACFNIWFSKRFLKGDKNDSMCEQLLKTYKSCVEKAMKEQQIEINSIKEYHVTMEEDKSSSS